MASSDASSDVAHPVEAALEKHGPEVGAAIPDSPLLAVSAARAGRLADVRPAHVLALQARAGNRAVGRHLDHGTRPTTLMRAPTAEAEPAAPPAGIPEGGVSVDKIGVVEWDRAPELRLRSSPDTTTDTNIIGSLPFATRLQIIKRFPGKWYFISTTDGRTGYCGSEYVRTDLPEPGARRHKVRSGLHGFAISIAEQYYKDKADDWGQDLRFYVNVLAWANGVGVPDTYDGWRFVHFKGGDKIWVPSQPFARSLVGKINSGSLSYEILDAVGLAGFLDRVGQLLDDFRTAIANSKKYMAAAVRRHVVEALYNVVVSLAVMLVGAIAVMALFTAAGAALGALAGGAGAGPGAAAGFELSVVFLEWLGLGFLVKWIADTLTGVFGSFGKFLSSVWNARGDEKKLDSAGYDFADAIGTLLGTLVEALVLWIASVGLEAGIARLKETSLGRRLGESFFKWLREQHAKREEFRQREERLRREGEEARKREADEKLKREREETERREREEAEKRAREEAERHAREEAARKQREEAERREREEADRRKSEEAEARARQEAEQRAREEAERRAREAADKRPDEKPGKEQTPAAKDWKVCFLAGTLVETESGRVPIERIGVGTRVLAIGPDGRCGFFAVGATHSGLTERVMRVGVGGGELHATRRHPFRVDLHGWTAARDLQPGHRLVSLNGRPVDVRRVTSARLPTATPTFNLTVREAANYFVSAGGPAVLVHNGPPKTPPLPNFDQPLYWTFGAPRGRTEGPKIDYDGISMWKTESTAEVKKMMELRVNLDNRKLDDLMVAHTEAQLKGANIALPETPGDPVANMTKAGFKHHSARPAASPDPNVHLKLEEITATQTMLRGAKGQKLSPEKLNPLC
jgi:flagellar biosynthesis GTPase FlhF